MTNKKAFLLFEVVLTIAVLSLGLVFVVRSISQSMKVARATFNYNRAINLAYERMFELELESQTDGVEPVSKEGVDSKNRLFNWRCSIKQLDDINLGLVLMDISWKEAKREGGFPVSTYVKIKD